jgi:hypothetical protein
MGETKFHVIYMDKYSSSFMYRKNRSEERDSPCRTLHVVQNQLYSICFITREYGGHHIGKRRFEIIDELVEKVLVNIWLHVSIPKGHNSEGPLFRRAIIPKVH